MDIWLITLISTGVFSGLAIAGGAIWYEFRKKYLVNKKISDLRVIEIARENGGKVNIALLCERTELTASEAKTKLKYLKQNGVLATDWKSFLSGGGSYVLPGSSSDLTEQFSKLLGNNEWVKKLGFGDLIPQKGKNTGNTMSTTQSRDAQIITLALENQGLVSASQVCLKLNISIDEAQRRLEELRQKQIFITEVSQNGGLLYRLLDI